MTSEADELHTNITNVLKSDYPDKEYIICQHLVGIIIHEFFHEFSSVRLLKDFGIKNKQYPIKSFRKVCENFIVSIDKLNKNIKEELKERDEQAKNATAGARQ